MIYLGYFSVYCDELSLFIDDRVRAISLAMGLTPMIWTRTPTAGQFDTNGNEGSCSCSYCAKLTYIRS